MSSWIDITRPYDETLPVWPGRTPPQHRWERSLAAGDHCNASHWQASAHSGTHMDAPLHFIAAGKPIDEIPPEVFIGPCELIDLSDEQKILDENIARRLAGVKRLLVRTTHSQPQSGKAYPPHGALATVAAIDVLIASGLLLIGVDRLSVDDSGGGDFALHRRLLGAGCVIVEGLSLSHVTPGSFTLYAAPLRLTGTEASPVRAYLRSHD